MGADSDRTVIFISLGVFMVQEHPALPRKDASFEAADRWLQLDHCKACSFPVDFLGEFAAGMDAVLHNLGALRKFCGLQGFEAALFEAQ